jgi:hypothetical protein
MSQSRIAAIVAKDTIREYTQGAAQDSTAKVADFLAPTVEVTKPVGLFKKYDTKNRFRIPDTARAIGGRATELGFDKSDGTFNCTPHALDVPVDVTEGDAEDSMEYAVQEAADLGAEVGGLSHEKTVIDKALEALESGSGTIDLAAAKDPIDQLDEFIINIVKAAKYGSIMGVGLLFGPTMLRKLKNHPLVRARFPGALKVSPSIDEIMSLLITKPEVRMTAMVVDTEPAGKAPKVDFLLDDQLIVFARRENPTRLDPSFMKTFRLRNRWMTPGTYLRDDGRVEVAKLDWSCDVQITNPDAGKLYKIA